VHRRIRMYKTPSPDNCTVIRDDGNVATNEPKRSARLIRPSCRSKTGGFDDNSPLSRPSNVIFESSRQRIPPADPRSTLVEPSVRIVQTALLLITYGTLASRATPWNCQESEDTPSTTIVLPGASEKSFEWRDSGGCGRLQNRHLLLRTRLLLRHCSSRMAGRIRSQKRNGRRESRKCS
jgi:hypothetical protein